MDRAAGSSSHMDVHAGMPLSPLATPRRSNTSIVTSRPVSAAEPASCGGIGAAIDDEETTLASTVGERFLWRSQKAVRASQLGAFNTFLKALFGISMLSKPAVLGEVGLVLGTFCHLFIIVGCAFACYLLLTARRLAINEVREAERRQQDMNDWEHCRARLDEEANDAAAVTATAAAVCTTPLPQLSESIDGVPTMDSKRWLAATHSYHRFDDPRFVASSSGAPMAPPQRAEQVRLVTYGDVAKYLAGPLFAQFTIFTIVTVHLLFASAMFHIAVENLCYIAGWDRLGFSYTDVMYAADDYYGSAARRVLNSESNDHDGSHSNDHSESHSQDYQWQTINMEQAEEDYAKWDGPDFIGRLAMASFLFPIIHGLLQIPSLRELATISTVGLVTYALGCVGSIMYSAFVLTDGRPFLDRPDDILQFKWSGIPTYVATTIYAIEGINLALPTVNTLEQRDQAGSFLKKGNNTVDKTDSSIRMVVTAVCCYGCITLFISWMGLAGGLGGGIGTIHEQEGCQDVTYCLSSVKVQYVYMLSLGVALVLTLPVILYPSTEMLEIWLDERADEKKRKLQMEAKANNVPNYEDLTTNQLKSVQRGILEAEASANDIPNPQNMTTKQLKAVRRTIRSRSLMDEEMAAKMDVSSNQQQQQQQHDTRPPQEDIYIEMTTITNNKPELYIPPNCSSSCKVPKSVVPLTELNIKPRSTRKRKDAAADERKNRARRKFKYWKLRMFLAFLICFIGTLEGSFPLIVRAAEVIRGVGLSIAGLISPPLLYMSAVSGRFSAGMASAMALLIGLGLFNIVLVLMSAFGGKDYIVEEGPGHYHEGFYDLDE